MYVVIGLRAIGHTAFEENGAVLVLVALALPVLIGVGGLVVDVGNWFAHKRHLQVQADAGALAAAGKFRIPCAPAPIIEEAAKYSSVEYSGPGYNPQIGSTPPERLQSEINSRTFYNQSTPVDDTVVEGDPCSAKMIDVKLTETELPWYLKFAQVPFINAQARVEIKQKTSGVGSLPIGVPDVGPQKAKAIFVDETTGNVVASTPLKRTGTNGGLSIWSNVDAPVPVTVDSAKIGVRIVLSGATSTNCGDPLVDCYGAGTSASITAGAPGLVHIRGWSSTPAGTATAPEVRNVDVLNGSCGDGYFSTTSSCTVGISAAIDGLPSTATVFAKRASWANTKVPLTYSGGVWTASSGIPVAAGEGAVGIELFHGNGNGTSIGVVHRTFAGEESLAVSGPIKMLRISADGVPGANSFERCASCSRDLVVTLGLKPSLQNAQSVGDPIVSLKVAGGGSQNQGLDCDPDLPNIRAELAEGCGPKYKVNDGAAVCPGSANAVWGTPEPWKCVAINTGAAVGQVTQGMNLRILGDASPSSCTAPNNWADFPDFDAGDPRIAQVFLTPFGAFSGAGGTTVPVTGFATFYVTGWDGGACQGSGDDAAGQGAIVGHFIKYIETLNNGGGGEEFCDFDSFGSCVAVLTR